MLASCKKASQIFVGSYEETALLPGISDVVVVKWEDGTFHSSPFLICFGSHTLLNQGKKCTLYINEALASGVEFKVDKFGYLHPMQPDSAFLARLPLRYGKNLIKFQL